MTAQTSSPDLARVRKVLRSVPLIDGHNDLPWRIRAEVTPPRDVVAYDPHSTAKQLDYDHVRHRWKLGNFSTPAQQQRRRSLYWLPQST